MHLSSALPSLDESGLLLNPLEWNETVAREIADLCGLAQLKDDHWRVIKILRNYYTQFGVAPAMVIVCRTAGKHHNLVHDLFGSCLNAWRVAGLPDPGEEAKSYLSDM